MYVYAAMKYFIVCSNDHCLCVLQPRDGADDMLNAERMQLLNMKKMYEAQLKLIKQQLHVSSQ